MQCRMPGTQFDHAAPRFGNRAVIEVVVAQYEIDVDTKSVSHPLKLKRNIVAFGDIAGDDQRIGMLTYDAIDPTIPRVNRRVVEMWIGCPEDSGQKRGNG